MEKNIKVSVIVPVYNVEKYLKRCIESLINQTLKDIEIILINDGSTDGSKEICEYYSSIDNRIILIDKKNGGLSDARNSGLDISKGKYITFVDSDDWCEHYMLEVLYNNINNFDLGICGYSIDYTNNEYSIMKIMDSKDNFTSKNEIKKCIYDLDYCGMFNMVWNKMYKSSILKEHNIKFEIDGMPGEDLLFNVEYFKYVDSISNIKKTCYHYMRQDEETLVYKYNERLYEQVKRFNLARKKLYEFYEMDNLQYRIMYSNTYIEYIFSCIPNVYRKSSKLSKDEKVNFILEIMRNEEIKNHLDMCNKSTFHIQLFKLLLKSNNEKVMYSIYFILFLLKEKFGEIYRIFRKKIIY